MGRIRYEVDPHNRLVAQETGKKSRVAAFREVLDGAFKIGEGNSLAYHIKRSSDKDTPQEIKFSGKWSLDKEHNLAFTLDKWNNQAEGNKLILKGELLGASDNELAFSIASRDANKTERIYMLKLTGAWQADDHNRLRFSVEKEDKPTDALTLQGAWSINKKNELIYTYAKNTITFRGYWDLTGKDRLSYILNTNLGSQFDFRVSFERALKKGLMFSLGIGAAPLKKRMTLFGRWKVDRGLGLTFEADCGEKGISGINLAAHYPLLKNQGEAFIKVLASNKEVFIGAGTGFRW